MKHQIYIMKNILTIVAFFFFYSISIAQVVISEIMYNDPSSIDSLEYVELSNAGNTTVNLLGYTFANGVEYTFPSVDLLPNTQILVAKDSVAMMKYFGLASRQWTAGALNNSGELLKILSGTGVLVDSVLFSDSNGWPVEADGEGYSLVLCDLKSDNNLGSNWGISLNKTNAKINNTFIYGTPLAAGGCVAQPLVRFETSNVALNEGNAGANLFVIKKGLGAGTQSAIITIDLAKSTAVSGQDFDFTSPMTINFSNTKVNDTVKVFVPFIDDAIKEDQEHVVFQLSSASLAVLPTAQDFDLTINDNDAATNSNLILTGVFDAQANGVAGAKGVEVYANDDIPDLSIYGLGSANNGGGSDGIEFTFPNVSVAKGTYLHVAADSTLFNQYFGYNADYIGSAMNINGDDAIELFENTSVIDLFGDINVDGTGTAWEYLDGWAYRKNGTGPDGNLFVIENWIFGGVNSLNGGATNGSVTNPFPINTYMPTKDTKTICKDDNVTTEFETSIGIDVLKNDILPNGVKTFTLGNPTHGSAVMMGGLVIYTPVDGYCGNDAFGYIVEDSLAQKDSAMVSIVVKCAAIYPQHDIATVTSVNALGEPDSLNTTCELHGVIYGNDFQGGNSIQIYLIDNTGGISAFSNNNFGYTVKEGDAVVVRGLITQFSGLTQISIDTLWLVSSNNTLKAPKIVTILSEETESEFIKLNKLTFKNKLQWTTGVGTGFNIDLVDGGGNEISMRIDNDIDLFNQAVPDFDWFNLTGIGSQFDNTSPYTSGYQILPRYASDIEGLVATKNIDNQYNIIVSPNPSFGLVTVKSDVLMKGLIVRNSVGQIIQKMTTNSNLYKLDLSKEAHGMYFISIVNGENTITKKLIIQ